VTVFKIILLNTGIVFLLLSTMYFYFEELKIMMALIFSNKFSIFYSIFAAALILIYAVTDMLSFASGTTKIEGIINAFIITLMLQPLVFVLKNKFKYGNLLLAVILLIFGIVCFFMFLIAGQKFPDIVNKKTDGMTPYDLFLISFCSTLVILAGWMELDEFIKCFKK